MKRIYAVMVCISLVVIGAYIKQGNAQVSAAASPNNVAAQLGANGVTDQIRGSNATLYAGYIVKTYSNGLIHTSLLPATAASNSLSLSSMLFVDSVNGEDTNTYGGRITFPYKTFEYAVSQASNGSVIVFMPGTYTATPISNVYDLTLVGIDMALTHITGTMQLTATNDFTLTLKDIQVDTIRQQQPKDLTLYLYDRAKVNTQVNRQYPYSVNSYLTVTRDPSVYLGSAISTSNSVDILLHPAHKMAYIPEDPEDWWTNLYTLPATIAQALSNVAARIDAGTNVGQLAYWSGTNWIHIPDGTSSQVLWGGTSPEWRTPTWSTNSLSPGTEDGELLYWYSGMAQWMPLPAGASNQVLRGGPVPEWVAMTNLVMDNLNGVNVGFRWFEDNTTNVLQFFSGTNVLNFSFFD